MRSTRGSTPRPILALALSRHPERHPRGSGLDQITDPHNVGAIVRTAAAFDVEAIITTARHSPAATGVLAKSAWRPRARAFMIVRNLGDALTALGERGFQRIGLDSTGETNLDEVPITLPVVLVLGSEGKGLRQRTRDCCDVIGRLDMPGAIKSRTFPMPPRSAFMLWLRALPGQLRSSVNATQPIDFSRFLPKPSTSS